MDAMILLTEKRRKHINDKSSYRAKLWVVPNMFSY